MGLGSVLIEVQISTMFNSCCIYLSIGGINMNFDYHFGSDYYNYYGDVGFKTTQYHILAPEQSQPEQPGMEYLMNPLPIFDNPNYLGSGKLKDKVVIITGGDSGLGRAAAIAFVKEGGEGSYSIF